VFQRNILPPSSVLKRKPSKDLLAACSSTLKMETACSSEMSADFQQAIQCYIPEDRTLHVGFEVFTAVVMESVSWDKMLYSLLKVNVLLPSSVFFDPEDGGGMFSEMLVDFRGTTRYYIPEGRTLQNSS
jgi:hypothetical protein